MAIFNSYVKLPEGTHYSNDHLSNDHSDHLMAMDMLRCSRSPCAMGHQNPAPFPPWSPHHGIGGFGAQGQRRIRHGSAGNGLDDWTPKTDGKLHGKMSGKIMKIQDLFFFFCFADEYSHSFEVITSGTSRIS